MQYILTDLFPYKRKLNKLVGDRGLYLSLSEENKGSREI